ncbi:MAG: hypothetical protein K1X53_10190 [Candidatus Sumerlaeaceae bacterium]|nr:hypothetical protein [Candidatus Sumerlaeaceae bacterium]
MKQRQGIRMRYFKGQAAAALFSMVMMAGLLGGCNRKTPQERLEKAMSQMQQGDSLGAMLEAKEVVTKFPEDPAAIQAHMILATVYANDRRPDEALAEYQLVIDKVSQKTPLGKTALQQTLALLKSSKRFDEALKTIDTFQKKYADDEGVSLSLEVARSEVYTDSGDTTKGRELIMALDAATTEPEIHRLYRQLITRSYMLNKDYASAIKLHEDALAKEKSPEEKCVLALQIAGLYTNTEDYANTRKWLIEGTKYFEEAYKNELDVNKKVELTMQMALANDALGNLRGAREILKFLYDTQQNPQLVGAVVQRMTQSMLREGKTSETLEFLQSAAARFPQGPFAAMATQLETMQSQGDLEKRMPRDTSTLVIKFAEDAPLSPKGLEPPPAANPAISQPEGALAPPPAADNAAPAPKKDATATSDSAAK